MNIYVGSLHYETSEANLKELFEEFGEVTSAKIITDKMSGRSKGFGFVEMESSSEASNAIKALNDAQLKGRNIVVNEAKSRN